MVKIIFEEEKMAEKSFQINHNIQKMMSQNKKKGSHTQATLFCIAV